MATTTNAARTDTGAAPQQDIHEPRTVVVILAAMLVGLVLAVMAIGQVRSSGIDPTSADPAPMGDTVEDGSFAFTVLDVDNGVGKVGDHFYGEQAQGRFTLVRVRIQNMGSDRRGFDAAFAQGFDPEGQQLTPDREAAYFIDEPGADLEPGEEAVVTLVFDTSVNHQPQMLRLHDSALSHGVLVSLHQ